MVKIQLETGSAAFADYPGEVSACLERVALRVESGHLDGIVRDTNGNTVGTFTVTRD